MADDPVPEVRGDDMSPTDTELLAWLRAALDPDGTLRVPRLVVADDVGHECIVLQRGDQWAGVVVSLPVQPGGDPTEVSLYATNGDPHDPGVDPSVGIEIAVAGNGAYSLDVVPDRWGGWELHEARDDPPTRS